MIQHDRYHRVKTFRSLRISDLFATPVILTGIHLPGWRSVITT